jgi:hypothetical protein
MEVFNVVIKGDLDQVKGEVETREVDLLNAHIRSGCVTGMVRGEIDVNYMNTWFLNGPRDAPYHAGTLLHWSPTPNLRVVGEHLA